MATDATIIVSGSNYTGSIGAFPLPNGIATSSIGAITGSMLGAMFVPTVIVSGSNYTGSLGGLFSPSMGASSSLGPITASMLGPAFISGSSATYGFPTLLVNFQTSTGSGGGGGSSVVYTYVMTGYYLAGATRETWSGPSINTPNPTGHPLVDIIVMGSYPPQNSAT